MKTLQERLDEAFDAQQLQQLERAADVIASPFTDPLAKNTVRKLYYNALLAAFSAGRLRGVFDAKITMEKVFAEHEAKRG